MAWPWIIDGLLIPPLSYINFTIPISIIFQKDNSTPHLSLSDIVSDGDAVSKTDTKSTAS